MFKTELKDRTLYFDGDSVVSPEQVPTLLDKGLTCLSVERMTDEIKQFNQLVGPNKRITIKEDCRPLSFDWNIPTEYKTLDVVDYLEEKLDEKIELEFGGKLGGAVSIRANRMYDELELYEKLGVFPILRTIIYIINTLQENNIVWGVGRGSSVSSYVLYLIGVHDVDSVKYNLEITDFLRE